MRRASSRALAALASAAALPVAFASPAPPPSSPAAPSPLALAAALPAADFSPLDLSGYALSHHLLHEALAGAEKLERYELALARDRQSLRAAVRLGRKACGHPTWVHGGAIASVFDDAMGTLFLASGAGSGFTGNLNVDYRAPLPAGAELRLVAAVERAETGKSGARKVFLVSRLEAADGSKLYAEARALFIVKRVPVGMQVAYVGSVLSDLVRRVRAALGGGGGDGGANKSAAAQPGGAAQPGAAAQPGTALAR